MPGLMPSKVVPMANSEDTDESALFAECCTPKPWDYYGSCIISDNNHAVAFYEMTNLF